VSDDKDYAHMRDPEAQRTRAELWAIVVIVVVVVAGALIWRAVAHKPAAPQKGWPENGQSDNSYSAGQDPAAAAGVRSQPPSPRPVAP
jgi:hypothetical protein